MYLIIWEYHVKADGIKEFERIYKPDGTWAELFRKGVGFLSTELLRDEKDPQHYLTIDRWASSEDYETFRSRWKEQYHLLDAQCTDLCERESYSGSWVIVDE